MYKHEYIDIMCELIYENESIDNSYVILRY